ncbi:hypothetical protein [Metabacillus schmidteae]|uniref:hypothetical protein n=1 Tax=Metabacillus schmidteae TaxID=2730405 RepID=UPI00158963F2|nr:hypothetical protein [Metabacillus schmidteae]
MVDNELEKETLELHRRVLHTMGNSLDWHRMLARYTKKTTKLKKHLFNISFMEESIKDYKQEYNLN